MVRRVQVMSDEEAERYNQWNKDLDDTCDKIKLCICWSLCILVFIYSIVTVILLTTFMIEDKIDNYSDNNDIILDDGSQ
jgi:hypothetical protein